MNPEVLGPIATAVLFAATLAISVLLTPATEQWGLYLWWRKQMWFWHGRRQMRRAFGGTLCTIWERGTLCRSPHHHIFCPTYQMERRIKEWEEEDRRTRRLMLDACALPYSVVRRLELCELRLGNYVWYRMPGTTT